MKYRKLPVVIEAEIFSEENYKNSYFLKKAVIDLSNISEVYVGNKERFIVRTLEGDMKVKEGDYIIRGVEGEHYPCDANIFLKTYEPAL